jgi:hypothetical protein
MFGFLRKNACPSLTAPSCGDIAPAVTPVMTPAITPLTTPSITPPIAPPITPDLSAAIAVRGAAAELAGRWILAQSIEDVIFPAVCRVLGWPRRSWKGKDGVAAHLARLLPPPQYRRTEIEGGEVRKLFHYFIPHPQNVVPLRR